MKGLTLLILASLAMTTAIANPRLEARGGVSCRSDRDCFRQICDNGRCRDEYAPPAGNPHPHPQPPSPAPPPAHQPHPAPPPAPPAPSASTTAPLSTVTTTSTVAASSVTATTTSTLTAPPVTITATATATAPPTTITTTSTASVTVTTTTTSTTCAAAPTRGVLGYQGSHQFLGEALTAYFFSAYYGLEVVSDAQTWSLNSAGNLVAPSGRLLITDGQTVFTEASPATQFYIYVCEAQPDSTPFEAVLSCVAQVPSSQGSGASSFQLCYHADGDDADAVLTSSANCAYTPTFFTQFTLSTI